jgi:GlcNAc-P-P-Und epimerase
MSKILITGGSGFIGRYFVEKFPGDEVIVFDLREPDYDSHAVFVKGDIRNAENIEQVMPDVDLLIHLAAMHHDFGIADEEYYHTNTEGAKLLAASALKHRVSKIINFSSVAVYGNLGNPGPTTENTQPAPQSAYGKSKLQAEEIFRDWASKSNGKLVIVRSTVVFGAWNLANVLNLIKAIDKGLYIHVGDGKSIKALAYVENIVDAALFALKHPDENVCLFNYVDYPSLTNREIATMQAGMLGKKIRIHIPLWFAMILAIPFDIAIALSGKNMSISSKRVKKFCTQTNHGADKIRSMGFVPKVSVHDGMQKMIRWYLSTKKNH